MANINKRLTQLERALPTPTDQPMYLSLTDEEWDLYQETGYFPDRYETVSQPTKLYIGISPDDWPEVEK